MRSISSRRFVRVGAAALAAAVLVAQLAASGCAPVTTRRRASMHVTIAQSNFTPEQVAQIDRNCGPWGMPVKTVSLGPTRFVTRSGYVLEHSSLDLIPLWVAEFMDADQPDDGSGRPPASTWKAETQLDEGERAELADYKGSEFDRGHMAPSDDFGLFELKKETFRLSNAVPQDSNQNQQIWRELEGNVKTLIGQRGEGFIITGPLFYEEEEDPELAVPGGDGFIEYKVAGNNEVAVPTHTYKIFLVPESAGSDAWESFAVVIPNKPQERPFDWASYARSIDWIEFWTGLNFLPDVPSGSLHEAQLEGAPHPAPW